MRYHQARSAANLLLSRIRNSAGHRKRDLIRLYFRSRAARFWTAYEVLGASADEEVVSTLVEHINPFAPSDKVVEWWRVPKRTPGGYRVVEPLKN
jgi:hypothetical protein